jgi:hypothetical protein
MRVAVEGGKFRRAAHRVAQERLVHRCLEDVRRAVDRQAAVVQLFDQGSETRLLGLRCLLVVGGPVREQGGMLRPGSKPLMQDVERNRAELGMTEGFHEVQIEPGEQLLAAAEDMLEELLGEDRELAGARAVDDPRQEMGRIGQELLVVAFAPPLLDPGKVRPVGIGAAPEAAEGLCAEVAEALDLTPRLPALAQAFEQLDPGIDRTRQWRAGETLKLGAGAPVVPAQDTQGGAGVTLEAPPQAVDVRRPRRRQEDAPEPALARLEGDARGHEGCDLLPPCRPARGGKRRLVDRRGRIRQILEGIQEAGELAPVARGRGAQAHVQGGGRLEEALEGARELPGLPFDPVEVLGPKGCPTRSPPDVRGRHADPAEAGGERVDLDAPFGDLGPRPGGRA